MSKPGTRNCVDLELTRDEARWIAVTAARLDRRPFRRRANAADVLDMVRYLRIVQLDTISVISRSHETVLWSRLGPYDVSVWPSLYDPAGALSEHFAHVASIIPREDLHLMRPVMERYRADTSPTGLPRYHASPENRAVMDSVLEHIRANGPSASRHFERPEDIPAANPWAWYGAKPQREALESLWIRGETALWQRDKGFGRTFDLMDRVLPGFWETEPVPEDEVHRAYLRTAMKVLGVSTTQWAADYYRSNSPYVPASRVRAILDDLTGCGELLRVRVDGIDAPMWLDGRYLPLLENLRAGRARPTLTTLLSPFDNLVWNRDRDERLFDFHYRIEVYTPAPKRVYGYYSMPILHRGRIVGRLDPSYSRKERLLTVKSLHLEPWVKPSESLARAVSGALDDLVAFLGGEAWLLLGANPPQILPLMQ
jgi:uncharacterized protein YcaQ